MKTTLLLLSLLLVPATASATDLTKPYTPTLGETIATDMAMLLDAMRANDQWPGSPTTVQYDKKAGRIEITILGSKASVDAAKKEVDDFWRRYFDIVTYRAETQYGVKLEDADFRLRYLNKGQEYAEVLKRENGKILLP